MRISGLTARAIAMALPIGLSQPVLAADLPARLITKAPAAVVSASWTGFYVNAGGGYGMWAADTTLNNPNNSIQVLSESFRQGGQGWLGRVGAGFDIQLTPHFVAGVFGDFDVSSIKGTVQDPGPFRTGDLKQTRSFALGGRFGWLVTPGLLSYFTGGYTNARFSGATMVNSTTGVPSGFVSQPFTRDGWFLGGGAEARLGAGWYWRNEYRYGYYQEKRIEVNNPATGANGASFGFRSTVQTVTTQLVYKFNPGIASAVPAARTVAANWNGLYANAGAGYGMWAADTSTVLVPISGSLATPVTQTQGGKGWLGRAGFGYDHQFSPRIVAGAFADFDIASLKGTIQDQGFFISGHIKETWAWAAGARLGWLVDPSMLIYGNGGYTMAHFSSASMVFSLDGTPQGLSTPAFTTGGWFVGGGMEAAIARGWFWRNEYRYARYDDKLLTDTGSGGVQNSINFKPSVQTVTTHLVYKFN